MTDRNPQLVSRRTMIAVVAAGTAAAGARAAAPLPSLLNSKQLLNAVPLTRPLSLLVYADWATLAGNSFTLMTDTANLAVRLAAVSALPVKGSRPAGLRAQPFMLLFTGPVLPAGNRIYRLVHPTRGALDTFFDPVSTSGISAQFN